MNRIEFKAKHFGDICTIFGKRRGIKRSRLSSLSICIVLSYCSFHIFTFTTYPWPVKHTCYDACHSTTCTDSWSSWVDRRVYSRKSSNPSQHCLWPCSTLEECTLPPLITHTFWGFSLRNLRMWAHILHMSDPGGARFFFFFFNET